MKLNIYTNQVYAIEENIQISNSTSTNTNSNTQMNSQTGIQNNTTNTQVNNKTNANAQENGQLVELKETQEKTLEDYKEKYASDSYGTTAYILHLVQVYSIPFCFVGIVISLMFRVILGVRHLESAEKGLGMLVAIVTVTIICQILPLVFAVVVKIGKE